MTEFVFFLLSASAAQIAPPCSEVSDIRETPSQPQDEATLGSLDTKQEIRWGNQAAGAWTAPHTEWMGVQGGWRGCAALSTQFQV